MDYEFRSLLIVKKKKKEIKRNFIYSLPIFKNRVKNKHSPRLITNFSSLKNKKKKVNIISFVNCQSTHDIRQPNSEKR